jgi:hypothetical protein
LDVDGETVTLPAPPSALCDCHGEEKCPDKTDFKEKVKNARHTISRKLSKPRMSVASADMRSSEAGKGE